MGKKWILLADDDDIMIEMMWFFLTRNGYYVSVVRSGRELYQLLLTSTSKYDLIITDIAMKDWNGNEGVEMARILGDKTPVLYISGKDYDGLSGILLRKPFKEEELKIAINISFKNNKNIQS